MSPTLKALGIDQMTPAQRIALAQEILNTVLAELEGPLADDEDGDDGMGAIPNVNDSRRWRTSLSPGDFAAMDYLSERYLFKTRTNSLRYALRAQHQRDMEGDANTTRTAVYARIKESCQDQLLKSRRFGPEELDLRGWSCWLGPDEFQEIAAIQKAHDLKHASEAARFSLRVTAELEGFKPDGGW